MVLNLCWIHADFMLNSVREKQKIHKTFSVEFMSDLCWIQAESAMEIQILISSDSCQIHAGFMHYQLFWVLVFGWAVGLLVVARV